MILLRVASLVLLVFFSGDYLLEQPWSLSSERALRLIADFGTPIA